MLVIISIGKGLGESMSDFFLIQGGCINNTISDRVLCIMGLSYIGQISDSYEMGLECWL